MSAPRWLCHGRRPGSRGRGACQALRCPVALVKGTQCSLMRLDPPIYPAPAGAGTGNTGCHELARVPCRNLPGQQSQSWLLLTVQSPSWKTPWLLPHPAQQPLYPCTPTRDEPQLTAWPRPAESGTLCLGRTRCRESLAPPAAVGTREGTREGAGGACPDALEGAGGASESSGWGWQGEGGRIKLARSSLGGAVGLDLER